jgi:hypothetical protein
MVGSGNSDPDLDVLKTMIRIRKNRLDPLLAEAGSLYSAANHEACWGAQFIRSKNPVCMFLLQFSDLLAFKMLG